MSGSQDHWPFGFSSRSGLSSQKKRRIREKDRERKQVNVSKSQKPTEPTTSEKSAERYTPEAAREAVYRVKSRLPKDPLKYAAVVIGLIKSATPNKRKAIDGEIPIHTPRKKRRLEFSEKT